MLFDNKYPTHEDLKVKIVIIKLSSESGVEVIPTAEIKARIEEWIVLFSPFCSIFSIARCPFQPREYGEEFS